MGATQRSGELFGHLRVAQGLRPGQIVDFSGVPFSRERRRRNCRNIARIYGADLGLTDRSEELVLLNDGVPKAEQTLHK